MTLSTSGFLGILCFVLLCFGCARGWERYSESLYHSMQEDSPEARENHGLLLAKIIDEAESKGKRPRPGLCAEYGFYLAKMQRTDQAALYLEKEIQYYPESIAFVRIINRMMKGAKNVLSETTEAEKK